MLTTCAFQLLLGRVYTFYSPKWIFCTCIFLFEVGSAVCGAAPSSTAFIIGRAISGVGCAGIFSGAIVIMMNVIPLHQRPLWMGLNGAIFAIASVIGPLIGGAFTSKVTWRWCFYINLPVGACSIAVVLLVLKIDPPMAAAGQTLRQKLLQLDPLGSLFFLPAIVCLLLALQWGGSTYAWSNGRVIALLVLAFVLAAIFITIQYLTPDDRSTIPGRVISQRSIAAGLWYSISAGSAFQMCVYYLPIWFQAIKGVDAIESGIRTIPLILSLVVAASSAGVLITKVFKGYYTPFMIAASVLMPIGTGLITTFTPDTPSGKWIGYQILLGFGIGMGMQQANLAAQTVLPRRDVSSGASLMFFGQTLGGSVFLSVGQNVLDNRLIQSLTNLHIPNFNPKSITSAGATDIRDLVPTAYMKELLVAYNDALMNTLYVAVAMACFSMVGAAAMEWRSVNQKKGEQQQGKQGIAEVPTKEEKVREDVEAPKESVEMPRGGD